MFFDINRNEFISPGSIGGKIKRIREHLGLSQKQLGLRCGFSESTADVRIRQYESNKKVPREKALKTLCSALEIEEHALFDADLLPESAMYHALFDIEDFHGLHPVQLSGVQRSCTGRRPGSRPDCSLRLSSQLVSQTGRMPSCSW